MSVSYPVADMLTKIRNGGMAKLAKVNVIPSKMKIEILKILKSEGYIKSYKKIEVEGKPSIEVYLNFDERNEHVISGIQTVSTPGRRIYTGYKTMPRVFNGYGVVVVSTSKGMLTGKKAASERVGGEIICKVW